MELVRRAFEDNRTHKEVVELELPKQVPWFRIGTHPLKHWLEKVQTKADELDIPMKSEFDRDKGKLSIAFLSSAVCDALMQQVEFTQEDKVKSLGSVLAVQNLVFANTLAQRTLANSEENHYVRRDKSFKQIADATGLEFEVLDKAYPFIPHR